MVNAIGRLADRVLARVAPRIDASAACTYQWYLCYCRGGLRYSKKCMRACPGVPDHCGSCTPVGTC